MERRSFLRTGVAATVGIGALGSVGCSQLPVVGSGGGAWTNWLHEPGEIGNRDHYSVNVLGPETIVGNEDVFDDAQVDALEDRYDGQLDPTGVDTDETRRIVRTNASTVFTGGFSAGDVGDELEDNGFSDDDEVGGFTTYATGDEARAWAVGSNALVSTRAMQGESGLDVAETVLEVGNGDGDRYADESDAMGVLTDTVSNGFRINVQTYEAVSEDNPEMGRLENSVGFGGSQSLNGDTVQVEFVVAYEEPDDVDTDDLEDFFDALEDESLPDLEDVSFSSSGRAGIVSGTMDADEATLQG